MTPDPVQIVDGLYEAFRRRDLPAVFGLLSPEVRISQSEELPWGGLYRGRDGARQFFGKLGANINSTLEVERLIGAADQVVAVGWTTGTVNATGAAYRVPIAHIWRVRDGLVVEAQFIIDHRAMLKALNMGQ